MTKFILTSVATVALLGASQVPVTDASSALASIASEIRLLRGSIEKANDNEVQIQAISVFLTNEQGRLVQVGNRLDSIRHDLDIATANSREAAVAVAGMESRLPDVPTQRRDQWEASIADAKKSAGAAAQRESDLRVRERDALQEFQTERDQYTAMVARLQQFIK